MSYRCQFCGDMDYSDEGDMPCMCGYHERPQEKQPEPTIEDYCGPEHFEHFASNGESARQCYCGKKKYPPQKPTPEH